VLKGGDAYPGGFSKQKGMVFPREVLVGHGVIAELGEVARRLGYRGPGLIVTGPTTIKVGGQEAISALEAKGFEVHVKECGSAVMESVDEVIEAVKRSGASFLIGVGGGSKIDIAKLAASKTALPFISAPTSAAHDGIASPRASIRENETPLSIDATMPIAVVADTAIIVQAPHRLLASGCADVISNAAAVLDWELAHRLRGEYLSTSAAALAKYSAESIIELAPTIRPGIEESVWNAVKPIISSGIAMSIAGTSRPASGAEHLFSHALDVIAPGKALHGEQCGVGTIMMMHLHRGDWKRIRSALLHIGAPTTAKELGVSQEQIVEALVKAHSVRPDRYTILGDRGLTSEAAERLATLTGVI
jgi:glycerol-1-phosphate dehydrogenase [NAD(P)+]